MSDPRLTTTVPAPPDSDPFWNSPLRDQVKEWLQANNISLRIPRRDITITGPPGNRTIHYTAFALDADGHIQVDPHDRGEALMEERTTPCLVEPPVAVTEGPVSFRLGDPIQSAVRCLKPECRRLLINGQACGCTWRADPNPDPLIGQLVALTDPDAGSVLAAGKVTDVDRADGGMTLTVVQHETPDVPRSDGDPATLPPGMNWRDHITAGSPPGSASTGGSPRP